MTLYFDFTKLIKASTQLILNDAETKIENECCRIKLPLSSPIKNMNHFHTPVDSKLFKTLLFVGKADIEVCTSISLRKSKHHHQLLPII